MEGHGYSTLEVRVRAVKAVDDGMSVSLTAHAFGVDRTTLHRWLRRHLKRGDAGLQRRPVSGRPRKLCDIDSARIKRIALAPATGFGFETDLWTVGRLHAVLADQLNVDVSEDTVWRRMREAGLTWQTPERQHFEADETTRRRWQEETIPEIRKTLEETGGILYCEDEASACLTPLSGKTWAERGKPRKVAVTGGRAGQHRGDVGDQPEGPVGVPASREAHHVGGGHRLLAATVETPSRPACGGGHGPSEAAHLEDDKGVYRESASAPCVLFAPYSPDWNPDGKVWNHLKNHELKAHRATNKQELYDLTAEKLENMSGDRDLLQGLYFRCCVAELLR